jgi:thioredoxin
MKRTTIIMILAAVTLASCSGQGSSSPESSQAQTKKEIASTPSTSKVIHLDKESFKQLVMDYDKNPQQWVFEGDKPCIIDFYADWCRPCKMIAPIMEELAGEYAGKVNIYKVNTDKERELASLFNITSIPYVLFVPAQGNPSSQRGAMPKESYVQIIEEFLLKKPGATVAQ